MRRFLVWAQRSGAAQRADAASALARAYLDTGLPAALRKDIAVVLAALLDDREPGIRRALSEAFAGARGAPRAVVVALANDRSEIAAPLLARSPLLTDAELVDCVAAGDECAQCAVARRSGLGAGPAAALAEVGTRQAALVLIDNSSAALTPGSLHRLFERYGDDVDVRLALIARAGLPASLEAGLAIATADALRDADAATAAWRAARDAALVAIAAARRDDELAEFVRTLRAQGALTLALLLRSLLCGRRALFAAALAELAGLSAGRAAGLVRDPRGAGFAAAALKAGLPRHGLPVFRAALSALATRGTGEGERLKAELIGAVIGACETERDPALAPFLALLWRLAAEAARADARARTRAAIKGKALPPNLDFAPANDDPAMGVTNVPIPGVALADGKDNLAPPVELPPELVLALNAA